MLILRRKEGQWVEITHRSGDVLRVRVCNVRSRYPGQVDLALDDDAHNFLIQRPERAARPTTRTLEAPAAEFLPQVPAGPDAIHLESTVMAAVMTTQA